jgi:hypothetical protein
MSDPPSVKLTQTLSTKQQSPSQASAKESTQSKDNTTLALTNAVFDMHL